MLNSLDMTEKTQFIEMPVAHLLDEADRRARKMGHLNQFTQRGLGGAQVGKLGELVAYEYLTKCGVQFEEIDCSEYDAVFYNLNNKYTLEVKTKERTVAPREDYECSAFAYNKDHQKPDYYIFISLLADKTKSKEDISRFLSAYVLGSMSGADFDSHSRSLDTGYIDPTNNWSPTKDTRNVYIRDLSAPKLSVW